MKLIPVALALFYQKKTNELRVWTQIRTDDGPFHGLWEFPGGGIESNETPLEAMCREVNEEVGIDVDPTCARLMGTYNRELPGKNVLLYVFIVDKVDELSDKGHWLEIRKPNLSSNYLGKIPGPNHQIIDDLFHHLYDQEL
jgi:mutator protein MutT